MEQLNLGDSKGINRRRRSDQTLHMIFLACTSIGILALMALIVTIVMDGVHRLSPELFTNFPSRIADKAGLKSPIVGTIYLLLLMAPLSFVLGVGAAIFLEEYAGRSRWVRLIQLNISTLAGVPSIIYGILGLAIFVRGMNLGRSLLSGY